MSQFVLHIINYVVNSTTFGNILGYLITLSVGGVITFLQSKHIGISKKTLALALDSAANQLDPTEIPAPTMHEQTAQESADQKLIDSVNALEAAKLPPKRK